MFTTISFQNLRCFKDFTLENLTPITLISGRNNVGKTTVLEGLFLLLAYHNADVFQVTGNWRGLEQVVTSSDLWKTFFTNMDVATQQLHISATDDQGLMRTVCLSKDTRRAFVPASKGQSVLQPIPKSDVLKFTYECSPGYESKEARYFFSTHNGVTVDIDASAPLPPLPFGFYTAPSIHPAQQHVAEYLGNVELQNKKEQLVKSLRFLHDEITDIFSVPFSGTNGIFSRLDTGKTFPIRAMGDGINKLLLYLSVMIANPGGVFLLDEIETGFHHLFYPKLWELVARVAKETGSQIFATTHSYECLCDAVDGIAEVDSSMLTYFRLGKEKEGIVPHSFSHEDLAFALERNMEVR